MIEAILSCKREIALCLIEKLYCYDFKRLLLAIGSPSLAQNLLSKCSGAVIHGASVNITRNELIEAESNMRLIKSLQNIRDCGIIFLNIELHINDVQSGNELTWLIQEGYTHLAQHIIESSDWNHISLELNGNEPDF